MRRTLLKTPTLPGGGVRSGGDDGDQLLQSTSSGAVSAVLEHRGERQQGSERTPTLQVPR